MPSHAADRHRAWRASSAPRGALVAGILASNRPCHVEAIQTRRHSLHRCKPSCDASAESLACSISVKGRGLNPGAARGIQYSVATGFYQLDRRSTVIHSRRVLETPHLSASAHQLRGRTLNCGRGLFHRGGFVRRLDLVQPDCFAGDLVDVQLIGFVGSGFLTMPRVSAGGYVRSIAVRTRVSC